MNQLSLSTIETLRRSYTNLQGAAFQALFQCSVQFIAGSTRFHGARNTNFLISFWRKQYINGFRSEFNTAQVRANGSHTTNTASKLKCFFTPTSTKKIVKAIGRKLSSTALTTNVVVLSALFSLTNLSTSSWGNCWVLILLSWRSDSRYKIA